MKRLLQAYQCKDVTLARQQLVEWYRQPLGERVLALEVELMAQLMPGLFGYHLLQLGDELGEALLAESRIAHQMVMSEDVNQAVGTGKVKYLQGSSAAIPVASDSLDVVMLPHLLEFEQEPHQVLREVERVLIPEGHVVILCFNPFSLFGLRRLLQGWRQEAPWSGHFYTPIRLKDWLTLLGFDTVLQRHYFHLPPLQQPSMIRRMEGLERFGQRYWSRLAGGYLLVAKKRVATITPIKPRWRTARSLIKVGLAEPSARRDNRRET